jgi:DNA polymerase III epsilon subunit family exonuclease
MSGFEYCALDFETTGLHAASSDVIEYGLVLYNADGLGPTLDSLCKPHRSIPTGATKVNGITDKMTVKFPYFEDQLDDLLSFIGDRTVVCHNTPFDMSFLNRYCRQAGKTAPCLTLDTLTMSRRTIRRLPSHSLGSVAHFLRIEQSSAHRALSDAMTVARIHMKLIELTKC